VAASRDPDVIVNDIEKTRAELADAIDAIATRMNPKRVAARGADALSTAPGTLAAVAVFVVLVVFMLRRRHR
jgi:Protein of unknown function (DUF3618)